MRLPTAVLSLDVLHTVLGPNAAQAGQVVADELKGVGLEVKHVKSALHTHSGGRPQGCEDWWQTMKRHEGLLYGGFRGE